MMRVDLSDVPAKGVPERTLYLRELTGTEELQARSVEDLVTSLFVEGGTVRPDELTLSEKDMAAVALYRSLYGEAIECFVPCDTCNRRFETRFDLKDWIATLSVGPEVLRIGANLFEGPGGMQFQLPTADDLRVVTKLPAENREAALLARCLLKGDPDVAGLDAAMARAGPLLDDEIEATCPHCDTELRFAVRLDAYLMAALVRERPIVTREVHHIASKYKWSRAEIMALPRTVRRDHVRLILSDHSRPAVAAWR